METYPLGCHGCERSDLNRLIELGEEHDRKTGGKGRGLSITERAVQLHDGNVTAANAPGGGLIIEIHLPVPAGFLVRKANPPQ